MVPLAKIIAVTVLLVLFGRETLVHQAAVTVEQIRCTSMETVIIWLILDRAVSILNNVKGVQRAQIIIASVLLD